MDQSVQYMNIQMKNHIVVIHQERSFFFRLQISSQPSQCHPLVSMHVTMTYAKPIPSHKNRKGFIIFSQNETMWIHISLLGYLQLLLIYFCMQRYFKKRQPWQKSNSWSMQKMGVFHIYLNTSYEHISTQKMKPSKIISS